jgi:hypothetical protein
VLARACLSLDRSRSSAAKLAVLLAVFGAGLFALLWRTDRFTRWRLGLEHRRLGGRSDARRRLP